MSKRINPPTNVCMAFRRARAAAAHLVRLCADIRAAVVEAAHAGRNFEACAMEQIAASVDGAAEQVHSSLDAMLRRYGRYSFGLKPVTGRRGS